MIIILYRYLKSLKVPENDIFFICVLFTGKGFIFYLFESSYIYK